MAAENYTEKVSVNVNSGTLSQIDLLVDNGYYSNRSDFINQAIRDALNQQRSTIEGIVRRQERRAGSDHGWFIGVSGFTKGEIAQMHQAGETTTVSGYGVLHIDRECDREQLYAVIREIRVRGKVVAPEDIRAHYGLK